jgi:hypothetical protein
MASEVRFPAPARALSLGLSGSRAGSRTSDVPDSAFADSRIRRFSHSPIPAFADFRIHRFPHSPISAFADSRSPAFADFAFTDSRIHRFPHSPIPHSPIPLVWVVFGDPTEPPLERGSAPRSGAALARALV